MQRRDAREEEWKPLMRPCVIRELSRPNEALTYLSYQPPSAPSCLLHTRTPTNTDDTQPRSRQTLLPGHDVTVLLSRREANACDEEEEEEEEKKTRELRRRRGRSLLTTFGAMITLCGRLGFARTRQRGRRMLCRRCRIAESRYTSARHACIFDGPLQD